MSADPLAALEVREQRAEDASAALALRNATFPAHPIGPEQWPQSQTAAVALLGGRLVGVIPFNVRDFEIAPGVVIRAAFANSVSVDEGLRDRGIGSRMMAAARRFLPAWAEAMLVYTGGERAALPYRFYIIKTGHHDLSYPRCARRPVGSGPAAPPDMRVQDSELALALDAELLDIYRQCYAGCAGTPPRQPGYRQGALASQIFVEIHYERLLLVTLGGDARHAYSLVGLLAGTLVVLEAAATTPQGEDELWTSLAALAVTVGAQETVVYGLDLTTPLYASARRAGFRDDARNKVLAGHALAPEAICAQRWAAASSPPVVALDVWTPARSLRLRHSAGPRLVLEMKEETLERLLFARLDLAAAVREQRVTVRDGDWALIRPVGEVLAPAPWVYHHLDDI